MLCTSSFDHINGFVTPLLIVHASCAVVCAAMSRVGELAGYRHLPVFGWLSASPVFSDKTKYNSLVRVVAPLNAVGKSPRFSKASMEPSPSIHVILTVTVCSMVSLLYQPLLCNNASLS